MIFFVDFRVTASIIFLLDWVRELFSLVLGIVSWLRFKNLIDSVAVFDFWSRLYCLFLRLMDSILLLSLLSVLC